MIISFMRPFSDKASINTIHIKFSFSHFNIIQRNNRSVRLHLNLHFWAAEGKSLYLTILFQESAERKYFLLQVNKDPPIQSTRDYFDRSFGSINLMHFARTNSRPLSLAKSANTLTVIICAFSTSL
jgi:hypothetical protein